MEKCTVENVFNILDINGIIINNNIGLIGNQESNRRVRGCIDINTHCRKDFVGDKYKVIDSDGCMIIDEDITHTFIIDNDKYCFILDKYKKPADIDEELFNDGYTGCVVIVKIDDKLYVNTNLYSELLSICEYDSKIEFSCIGNYAYKLRIGNKHYSSNVACIEYNIYNFALIEDKKEIH